VKPTNAEIELAIKTLIDATCAEQEQELRNKWHEDNGDMQPFYEATHAAADEVRRLFRCALGAE
jgi:hypothetical protein